MNLKLLDRATSIYEEIMDGEPETSGATVIAYMQAVLGAAQAWLEQLEGGCEAIASNYIKHEAANSLCIEAIAHMEEKIRSTERKVCKLQVKLGFTDTLKGLAKEEAHGKFPLACL